MSEYSTEVEMLSLLADRLAELITAVAATKGIRSRKITPVPRPVTALDRMRARRRKANHRFLVGALLPGRTPAGPPEPSETQRPPRPSARRALPPSRTPPPTSRAVQPRTVRSGWSSP